MTAGYFSYFPNKNGQFDQPELSLKILNDFVFLNKANIPKDEPRLSRILHPNLPKDEAFDAVCELVSFLASLESGQSALCIDQVNVLFKKTEYHDEQLKNYTINRFPLLQLLKDLVLGQGASVRISQLRAD
jgi:hypothetical protein